MISPSFKIKWKKSLNKESNPIITEYAQEHILNKKSLKFTKTKNENRKCSYELVCQNSSFFLFSFSHKKTSLTC